MREAERPALIVRRDSQKRPANFDSEMETYNVPLKKHCGTPTPGVGHYVVGEPSYAGLVRQSSQEDHSGSRSYWVRRKHFDQRSGQLRAGRPMGGRLPLHIDRRAGQQVSSPQPDGLGDNELYEMKDVDWAIR